MKKLINKYARLEIDLKKAQAAVDFLEQQKVDWLNDLAQLTRHAKENIEVKGDIATMRLVIEEDGLIDVEFVTPIEEAEKNYEDWAKLEIWKEA